MYLYNKTIFKRVVIWPKAVLLALTVSIQLNRTKLAQRGVYSLAPSPYQTQSIAAWLECEQNMESGLAFYQQHKLSNMMIGDNKEYLNTSFTDGWGVQSEILFITVNPVRPI